MTVLPQSIGISLVDKIRADILTARLRPGTKLTVKTLGDLHACGATPVREALTQLASDGLVLRIDRRGFFVAGLSRAEFEDILFNRCFLEGEALRRSIQRGGTDWEEAVLIAHHRLLAAARDASEPGAPNPGWEQAHKGFHMALLSACASPILLAHCDKLHELNNRYRIFARRAQGPARPVGDEHLHLRDLALTRQADAAVAALADHYRRTGKVIFDTAFDTAPAVRTGRATPRPQEISG